MKIIDRAALSHPVLTGISSAQMGGLIEEQWRPMQRWIGRRNSFEETFHAVASLVSDRTAKR